MKRIIFTGIVLWMMIGGAWAQKQVRKDIRDGNKAYQQEKYTDAEVKYRQAIAANAHSTEGAYNLGNALYKQGKGQEALEQYQAIVNNETDKTKLAQTWHNVGNVFLVGRKDQQTGQDNPEALKHSIEAYKNALRLNPKDDETRYNLALAQKLLENSQNNGQDQNQQQDQQQNQDQQQQNQQQNQDQQQQDQQQQDQQQNNSQMSKENAEQILDAMMQEEKDTQEKVKMQQQQQQKRRKTDKNW
ncbi:MAG: tetratricopeptide repeat protein [Candidatus Symbiothrix sp.]|jgi:tetratricopeptide (TPR) repeat protein|nr:tetratricopeptide repeat protein [Candidatus Symbiothrix sp.]